MKLEMRARLGDRDRKAAGIEEVKKGSHLPVRKYKTLLWV